MAEKGKPVQNIAGETGECEERWPDMETLGQQRSGAGWREVAAAAAENGTNWFTAAGKACSHYGGREAGGEMHVGKNHSQHSNWILMLSWKCLREPATLWLPDTEVVVFLPFLVFLNKLEMPSGEGTSTCS